MNSKCVGSKEREGAKVISLAFVLLDFQHAGLKMVCVNFITKGVTGQRP